MSDKERLELAHWVIKYAQQRGAHEIAVSISDNRSVEVDFRDKKIDKLQESTESALSLSLYIDHRYSAHSTSDIKKQSLAPFIEKTIAMTKYLAPDPYRELPDKKLYEGRQELDLEVFDAAYNEISPEKRIQLVKEVEAAASSKSPKILSVTAGYYDGIYEFTKVHSNGFEGNRESTSFSLGASVTISDQDDRRPEDWFFISTRHLHQFISPEEIGQRAAKRALAKMGMRKVGTQRSTMIVENRAAGRLISALFQPLSGAALQQKKSCFDSMLNQQIASPAFTVIDDPFVKRGMGSRLFDGEGISARIMPVIQQGILKNYFIDTYYARKLKVEPTFGAFSNLVFESGTRSQDEIVKSVDKGILVTTFLGGNSNSTTGDFSFGLQGFLIENGTLSFPVNEMNISGNIKTLWKGLVEVGNDPYPYSSVRIPTLRFDDIQFSGS
ncbi:TldD/PmbA family protein [candidate division KSB1 bacterium]|nr:TldD/PmbA family protein [candidate division KSB1 bacterium]